MATRTTICDCKGTRHLVCAPLKSAWNVEPCHGQEDLQARPRQAPLPVDPLGRLTLTPTMETRMETTKRNVSVPTHALDAFQRYQQVQYGYHTRAVNGDEVPCCRPEENTTTPRGGHPMSQPTTGSCACDAAHAESTPSGYQWGPVVITYCPMHAQAPAMLAALQALWSETMGAAGIMAYYHDADNCEAPAVCQHCQLREEARAILRAIDGQS